MGWSRLQMPWMETETASTARAVLPGCPWIRQRRNVPDPHCSWHRWSCANVRETATAPAGTEAHTHTAAVFHGGIAACPWGWGRRGNFQPEIQWIGRSASLKISSQKVPSFTTATCLVFVVAIESQRFCRCLHSKLSDWICVFKLSHRTCLCCSKSRHLPSPDNLLYFLFWPSDYGSVLVCFELTGKVSTSWIN